MANLGLKTNKKERKKQKKALLKLKDTFSPHDLGNVGDVDVLSTPSTTSKKRARRKEETRLGNLKKTAFREVFDGFLKDHGIDGITFFKMASSYLPRQWVEAAGSSGLIPLKGNPQLAVYLLDLAKASTDVYATLRSGLGLQSFLPGRTTVQNARTELNKVVDERYGLQKVYLKGDASDESTLIGGIVSKPGL